MKFRLAAVLLGTSLAADDFVDEALLQEDAEMEDKCKDMDTIDESSLLETEEDKHRKVVKNTYKKHYGRTKAQIDRENRHILTTQSKCLRFVKRYRGHMKVCNWCKKAPPPKVIWKWSPGEKVWYRWYDRKWHYWGPSKRGFTALGWTWWQGYWHHSGYVFKFKHGMWWRFQGGRWTKYGRRVPISPKKPRGQPICRPFYRLMKAGFPVSLSSKRLPRCKVGSGKNASVYQWKDRAACRFLGGRLIYQKIQKCKKGKQHSWKRVTKCVRGPVLTSKGLNYKKGGVKKGFRAKNARRVKKLRSRMRKGLKK